MAQVHAIREREAAYISRMARIRALNMAASYAITPLVSLITFAVARATSQCVLRALCCVRRAGHAVHAALDGSPPSRSPLTERASAPRAGCGLERQVFSGLH